jgi:peroxiredoxin
MKLKFAVLSIFFLCVLNPPAQPAGFLDFKQVEIGKEVPNFSLVDLEGNAHPLSDYSGKVVVLHFWSATCPFVLRYEKRIQSIAADYADKNVVVLGIDSNENETLKQIQKVAKKRELNYAVLMDPENKVADQFGAITTPHVFIIDTEGKLVYEGAIDDQGWSEENPVKERFVRNALTQVLAHEPVANAETKTVGCTVKRAF